MGSEKKFQEKSVGNVFGKFFPKMLSGHTHINVNEYSVCNEAMGTFQLVDVRKTR